MRNLIKIHCLNNHTDIEVEMGTSLLELARELNLEGANPYLAAFVNHKLKELNYKIYSPAKVEFFDITPFAGFRVYQRSLIFIMQAVVSKLYPSHKFYARHAIGDSVYCGTINRFGAVDIRVYCVCNCNTCSATLWLVCL